MRFPPMKDEKTPASREAAFRSHSLVRIFIIGDAKNIGG